MSSRVRRWFFDTSGRVMAGVLLYFLFKTFSWAFSFFGLQL